MPNNIGEMWTFSGYASRVASLQGQAERRTAASAGTQRCAYVSGYLNLMRAQARSGASRFYFT